MSAVKSIPGPDEIGLEPTPSMLHAAMFSATLSNGIMFGTTRDECVAALRNIAASVERGDILPQSAKVESFANQDDFLFTTLTFVCAEKKQPAHVEKAIIRHVADLIL